MAKGLIRIDHPDIKLETHDTCTVMHFKNTAVVGYMIHSLQKLESEMKFDDEKENCNPLHFATEAY